MPTYVNPDKCDGCKALDRPACMYYCGEAHARHTLFREETRWPGYYYRGDFPKLDETNWKCFVNSRYDRNTGKWELKKVPYKQLIKD